MGVAGGVASKAGGGATAARDIVITSTTKQVEPAKGEIPLVSATSEAKVKRNLQSYANVKRKKEAALV